MWDNYMISLELFIDSFGIFGIFVLLLIQILQVVIAFIPGEPIEILAGLLYGTLPGFLICLVGMLIGTFLIYFTMKKLSHNRFDKFLSGDKISKFKILNNTKSLETLTFIMFFIPGTPKDLLTYFMPLTNINPKRFFFIVALARTPSIISSTYAGDSLGEGNWLKMSLTFILIIVTALLGIKYNSQIIDYFSNKNIFKK